MAVLTIYPLLESGLQWFQTFTGFHKEKLKMTPSIYDTCLMYTEKCLPISSRSPSVPRGVVCLQTDGTIYTCNKAFYEEEESLSKRVDCKAAKFVKNDTQLKFNGAIVSRDRRTYFITQRKHIEKLSKLDVNSVTTADFVAE